VVHHVLLVLLHDLCNCEVELVVNVLLQLLQSLLVQRAVKLVRERLWERVIFLRRRCGRWLLEQGMHEFCVGVLWEVRFPLATWVLETEGFWPGFNYWLLRLA
jgi:hypothetical protein